MVQTVQPLSTGPVLEDPVTRQLMGHAVTLIPCGHILDEGTVQALPGKTNICPVGLETIQRWIPNEEVRQHVTAHRQMVALQPQPAADAEELELQGPVVNFHF
jgi:hypothetical protein